MLRGGCANLEEVDMQRTSAAKNILLPNKVIFNKLVIALSYDTFIRGGVNRSSFPIYMYKKTPSRYRRHWKYRVDGKFIFDACPSSHVSINATAFFKEIANPAREDKVSRMRAASGVPRQS
jgi:hypothetical protein